MSHATGSSTILIQASTLRVEPWGPHHDSSRQCAETLSSTCKWRVRCRVRLAARVEQPEYLGSDPLAVQRKVSSRRAHPRGVGQACRS